MIDNDMVRLGLLGRLFWPKIHEDTKLSHLVGKRLTVAYTPSESIINVRKG